MSPTAQVLWGGFALAAAFGAIAQRTHFCTMGAVADIVNMEDWTRMRMWLLAIGVAILGSAALHAGGLIDLDKSIYRGARLNWLAHLVGGYAFGYGMVLASGCGAKTLVRVGGGNLKSLVVFLVTGLTAYMTMRGLFALPRVNYLEAVHLQLGHGQDIPAFLAAWGLPAGWALALPVVLLGGGLVGFALAEPRAREFDSLLGGIGSGLCVVAAWYVSGHLGYLAEDPETLQEAFVATNSGRMEALTFVAPQAYSLELLMLWSDSSRKLSFAVVTAAGVILGSALQALASRRFRWEAFRDVEDTGNHLLGASLMGFGGVTAMGCTIGQGLSGLSTLAVGAFLTFFAILAGARHALVRQYRRLMGE